MTILEIVKCIELVHHMYDSMDIGEVIPVKEGIKTMKYVEIEVYAYGRKIGAYIISESDWSRYNYIDYVALDERAEFEKAHGVELTNRLFSEAKEAIGI